MVQFPMSPKTLGRRKTVHLLSIALGLALMLAGAHAEDRRAKDAEAKMAAGEALADRGQFEEAVLRWRDAEKQFGKA